MALTFFSLLVKHTSTFVMSSSETSGASATEVLPFRRHQVPAPNPPNVDGDRADNWKIWKQRWDNYCIITGLLDQPEDYKCAMLFHSIGIEAMRIFNGLKFSDGEDSNNMADVVKKFDQHFLGKTQEFFERFQFNRRNQKSGDSIDEYMSVLRNMAKTCGFCDCMRELLIMDRILLGILDDKTREELLSTHELTLVKAIEICRAREAATINMKALKNEEINKVKGTQKQKKPMKPRDRTKGKQHQTETIRATTKKCYFCKQVHAMRKESCPAWGKVCTSCGEKNHFLASRKCKSRSVHVVRDDYASYSSTSSTGTISTITVEMCHDVNSAQSQHPLINCEMLINNKPVRLQFDCGATACILPKRYLKNLEVRPEIVNLQMWNKSSVKALGKCKVHVKNPVTNEKFKVDFVIVNEAFTPLLSGNAAQAMGLITVNYGNFKLVNGISTASHSYIDKFPAVFKDTPSILPGKRAHLTVEDGATPVVRCARTLPEARKDAVKAELKRLVDESIIVPIDEPTDWVSQMSVAEKKAGIRICIDPRPLNEVLKREHYKLPVLDDVLPELTSACKFSVRDLKSGYLHCELDHESSLLTNFATPFGRFRWLRPPFGLKVSSEIFQKRLHQALEGLEGVRCIADDVIVWDRSNE